MGRGRGTQHLDPGAEVDLQPAGRAGRQQRERGVRAADHDRHLRAAERRRPDHRRARPHLGQQLRRHPRRGRGRRRPAVGDDVPQQRGRGVAAVGDRDVGAGDQRRPQRVLGQQHRGRALEHPGSWAASQARTGPVMPGTSGLASAARSASGSRRQRASSAAARPSGQSTAGRTGRPAASTSTAPCICPDRPSAPTGRPPSAGTTSPSAASSAARHTRTSVSAHPGRGRSTAWSRSASATTTPPASSATSFRPLVPTSAPRKTGSVMGGPSRPGRHEPPSSARKPTSAPANTGERTAPRWSPGTVTRRAPGIASASTCG